MAKPLALSRSIGSSSDRSTARSGARRCGCVREGVRQAVEDEGPRSGPGTRMQAGEACIWHVAIPLKVADRLLGALGVLRASAQPLAEHAAVVETVAAHLALADFGARNVALGQQEAWITTVLLKVALYAARTGDADQALQALLLPRTMLACATWAIPF